MSIVCSLTKEFTFDAAHHLPCVPADHKCHRMHGHTYRVVLELTGPVGDDGMVVDYAEIAEAWKPLHDALDHRVLNDIPGMESPTTEMLVRWIAERIALPQLSAVTVYESATTSCTLRLIPLPLLAGRG